MTAARKLNLAAFICILLMLKAASAHAALPDYEAPAVKFWGAAPACAVTYEWFDADPFEQYDGIAAAGRAQGCQMWLSRPYWLSVRRPARCRLFLHEWGHLVLWGSDEDHRALYAPGVVDAIARACAQWERARWQAKRKVVRFSDDRSSKGT